jgi:hypothetical protein
MEQRTEFGMWTIKHGKLAALYGVSRKTFVLRLKPFQEKIGEVGTLLLSKTSSNHSKMPGLAEEC